MTVIRSPVRQPQRQKTVTLLTRRPLPSPTPTSSSSMDDGRKARGMLSRVHEASPLHLLLLRVEVRSVGMLPLWDSDHRFFFVSLSFPTAVLCLTSGR